ncbi:MAG TPA: hypothetical protein VN847_15665 [Streptosporangiaceae bacterium]|nr:hypothetical protein [Streptosporangiaceae bacterium]
MTSRRLMTVQPRRSPPPKNRPASQPVGVSVAQPDVIAPYLDLQSAG